MDPQKFVARLLDEAGALLAWATVYALPASHDRAGSCPFWPVDGRSTPFIIERAGRIHELTIHWCALDVARRAPLESLDVHDGQSFAFHWIEPVWLVGGTKDVPLPAVTERAPIAVDIATGSLAGST
jgi:hypothetical protein